MQTDSGKKINPFEFHAEDITIWDISLGLSRSVRFAGHTKKPYTVAQHSVVLSHIVTCDSLRKPALLHDSVEAYMGDIPRPFKHNISALEELRVIENNMLSVIFDKFGIGGPLVAEVKAWDTVLLLLERKTMMRKQLTWGLDGKKELQLLLDEINRKEIHKMLEPMSMETAQLEFLHRYFELWGKW